MIVRDPPFFFDVSCDECPHGNERIETEDFRQVIDEIKSMGWKVSRKGGDWCHSCPDCAKPGVEFT